MKNSGKHRYVRLKKNIKVKQIAVLLFKSGCKVNTSNIPCEKNKEAPNDKRSFQLKITIIFTSITRKQIYKQFILILKKALK